MTQERSEIIKQRIQNNSFFTDAKDWFCNKNVYPYKSKFDLLILLVTIFLIIIFFALSSISSVSHVNARNGVVNISSNFDQMFIISKIPKYYPNNEKNILRFMIESYVNVFESHDIQKFEIHKIDEKESLIKKRSSREVSSFFSSIIKKNYIEEIFAGVNRKVQINSIEFIYDNNDWNDRLMRYLFAEVPPKKVLVKLTSFANMEKGKTLLKKEDRNIQITFSHKPLKRDSNNAFEDIAFNVVSYSYINL